MANENKIKLAEQALASHRAKLATTANKDEILRAIAATENRIRRLHAEATLIEATEKLDGEGNHGAAKFGRAIAKICGITE